MRLSEATTEERERTIDRAYGVIMENSDYISPELLGTLARFDNEKIKAAVATSKNLTRALMTTLSQDDSAFVRAHLGLNHSVPSEVIDTVLDDIINLERSHDRSPRYYILTAAASNPNLTPEVIKKIYKKAKNRADALNGLASNPNTPGDMLSEIIEKHVAGETQGEDGRSLIPMHLAENPNLTRDLLIWVSSCMTLHFDIATTENHFFGYKSISCGTKLC